MEQKIINLKNQLNQALEIYVSQNAIAKIGETVKVQIKTHNVRRYPLGYRMGLIEDVFADILNDKVEICYQIRELKKDGISLSKNLIYSGRVTQDQLLT
jgi:adenylate kinase